MTAQSKKTTQKRLHNYVLPQLKWAKKHENIEKRACRTVIPVAFAAPIPLGVENEPENGQAQRNTRLLGKYRLN